MGRDSGGMARQGAHVAGFLGEAGGAPRHGRGGQQLAPPGPTHCPQALALPPEEPAAAVAPPLTQAAAQVTAAPSGNGPVRRAQGGGGRIVPQDTHLAGPGPPTQSAPPPRAPRRSHSGRTPATPGRGEGRNHEHADTRDAGTPLTCRPLTNNC